MPFEAYTARNHALREAIFGGDSDRSFLVNSNALLLRGH